MNNSKPGNPLEWLWLCVCICTRCIMKN